MERTAFRTCPFCEATCGLEVTVRGDDVVKVRGDADDVFSRGFLCPKGVALKDLHDDPDRLRTPLVRGADGELRPAGWEEAFGVIAERLAPLVEAHGRDAVAVYVGNPAAHGLAALLYGRVLIKALGTRSVFSASTVDQRPKEISSGLMFGAPLSIPIPDVDRTRHLLMLGANPLASNGSLLTAPDMRGRLKALRARGGKLVVVDPRRSRTAEVADEHHPIRPGTDAHLLFALVHVLFAEELTAPGRLTALADGIETVEELAQPFTPEAVAPVCGIDADTIRRMARELAAAESAAVYGRIGTTTQEFGTLASWLIDVLNVLTGNLDRPGGAMFTRAAAGQRNSSGAPGQGRGVTVARRHSRVRGLPESFGELPVAALAEEIETSGEGQIRALVTLAGNPARSTPNSARIERAIEGLDLYVAIDIYVNETTRHADVILPAPSPLQRSHYDLALYQLAVRNVANFSPPVLPPDPDVPDEWVTLLRLAGVAAGQGMLEDVEPLDRMVAGELLRRETGDPHSPLHGRDIDELLAEVEPRRGPERLLDLMLRAGPYDLTLADLEAAPHGIDLGPLEPRLPDALRTAGGKIELAPAPIVADVARLRAALRRPVNGGLVLVGRRQLRSNNSWMHNLELLVSGPERCTLHVHPDDAARLGLEDGAPARVENRAGALEAPVEVTDAIMPGVVSMPHGWGHGKPGTRMSVANDSPGVNTNILSPPTFIDEPSGNGALNGIPVTVAAVAT
ncbi:MAG TPA: molybdopterin-dependent oxidoreductase [Solirubrobacteraceae bacterium]|nr:molybdopterin-dependent oxidoreductase [Solirubrobacteraceae bacterium]